MHGHGHGHHHHGHGPGGPGGPGFGPAYAQTAQTYKIPDSAHEHPLNYVESLPDTCKICSAAAGKPGYKCDSCGVQLCLDCSQKIFYGDKKKQCHEHELALRIRSNWKCDLCKQKYKNVCSFYCKPCDFDACFNCYIGA